jgi:hypothetical protein
MTAAEPVDRTATISAHDAAQVERANATGLRPIVFVHERKSRRRLPRIAQRRKCEVAASWLPPGEAQARAVRAMALVPRVRARCSSDVLRPMVARGRSASP